MPPEIKIKNVKVIHRLTNYRFVVIPLTTTRYLSLNDPLIPILRIYDSTPTDLITCW